MNVHQLHRYLPNTYLGLKHPPIPCILLKYHRDAQQCRLEDLVYISDDIELSTYAYTRSTGIVQRIKTFHTRNYWDNVPTEPLQGSTRTKS
jgi:hypothetical protein